MNRYWRHLGTMHQSTVFLRILEPVLIVTAWATFVTLWNSALVPAVVAAVGPDTRVPRALNDGMGAFTVSTLRPESHTLYDAGGAS